MERKCEVCGKELSDPWATHCSEECIFQSIAKANKVATPYPARRSRSKFSR